MTAAERTVGRLALSATFLAVTLAACAPKEPARDTARATAPDTASAPAAGPSDAEIAHIVVTANSLDSTAAAAALGRTKNAKVRDFAQMMLTDHSAVNRQAIALATRLGVTPADNDVSRGLQTNQALSRTSIGAQEGAAYDSAYITHEVAYHQQVIATLEKTLIPSARNAELKKLLEEVFPALQGHLAEAKLVEASLAKP